MWKFVRFWLVLAAVTAGMSWLGYHSQDPERVSGFRQSWLLGLCASDADIKAADLPVLPTLESKLTPEELKQYKQDTETRNVYFAGQAFAVLVNLCVTGLVTLAIGAAFVSALG